ncbi:MAG: response regulator transcription factor [Campylobacterota bacterium]|nr:response regulator transcription factor [Campylobacterota bacterium]
MNQSFLSDLSTYTLLFVENEKGIRDNLEEILSLYFKKVHIAIDGQDGLEKYKEFKPDLIITDIKMPHLTGIEMIQEIRQTDQSTDIVIISAYTEVDDILTSVELSLLKYIVKPITQTKLEEIFALFLTKHKRSNLLTLSPNCIYNQSKNSIMYNDEEFLLTNKENSFIQLLLEKNSLVTYSEIEDKLWNQKSMSQNALRLFIKNLRKKIPIDLIKNIQNEGYLIQS